MKYAAKLLLLCILGIAVLPFPTQVTSTRETVLLLLKDYSPDSYI